MELAKSFEPGNIENRWYDRWEAAGYFKPSMDTDRPSFCIQLPPPNVTGTLHMGHAFNQTIMDGLTRYYRMKGDNTLWVPGADHAGIATQIVVERQLAEQGVSRHDLGRDAFIGKVWEWKEKSGGTITSQMRRVGCSVDWDKEYFTMDDKMSTAVTEVFVRLYEQGLIYRGKRLVNWDPKLGTAVSDLEVISEEEDGKMWHIRYPVVGSDDVVVVATTRPETLLGDVAVAVNPDDERYRHLVGKQLELPLTGRTIPVIADDYVDAAFGTGFVKITPAHDFNDYQVGKRHNTALINVMSLDATMLAKAQVFGFDGSAQGSIDLPAAYAGLSTADARKAMLADLDAAGLLVDTKPHKLMVPRGDRTGSVIEPLLTDQWFVAMTKVGEGDATGKSITQKAIDAVESGEVRFVPENWVNTYNQWMNNIQDWCISRQLWWGHQIPAWYDEDGKAYVGRTLEEVQAKAPGKTLRRDEDVLDTWFSSALVPFSSLGWPNETPELKAFVPSQVLVTGYEIIFFWVARMIMMTTHFLGKVPFKDVYIHGIVRDHEGKKMSKSEGNVIDPVDLIDGIALPELITKRTTGLRRPEKAPQIVKATEKLFPEGIPAYGTDALRFTMASYASLGRSVNFDFKRAEGYRNFCNKLWNATRFVMMNVEGKDCGQDESLPLEYSFVDKWIISRLQELEAAVTEALDTYRFDMASQLIYEFVWNEYCDWYVELAKVQLANGNEAQQRATRRTLVRVLEVALRLTHPLMPFITEELWQTVAPLANAKKTDSIMVAAWPVADMSKVDAEACGRMTVFKELVNAIRNLRGEMNLGPSVKAPLFVEGPAAYADFLPYARLLGRLSDAAVVEKLPEADAPVAIAGEARLMLKVEIDKAAETARLTKEIGKAESDVEKLTAKLEKPGYVDKAPAQLVERDRAQLADLTDKLAKLKAQLLKLA
ncbi:valine--tRNA ligase [Laribacter hongkongensis]|uniref:Valine--tRNA ligase n=1 Tax=Laribacter hongkongensis TaxID=168471 RepID=A0ABD4SUN5_9NEIS|nr:valine--tRNA ligase [Laribacter hongkongensis]MCG9026823.1 valine--tRNA ligase [Laribacter hongkongensis]MCG9100197.1 valine--tRNA ligase [Laribacter hongkongensis]MCG9104913.1 valine--tRNA ligase [Laribacter hongkongensis]MCG9112108.1 valine--tRNA ligase [Laribacter hongkongensis]MCG9119050.1 valine--tRNA ligase [Laribacter hongkongensis]